jgi:hypothetical protein
VGYQVWHRYLAAIAALIIATTRSDGLTQNTDGFWRLLTW